MPKNNIVIFTLLESNGAHSNAAKPVKIDLTEMLTLPYITFKVEKKRTTIGVEVRIGKKYVNKYFEYPRDLLKEVELRVSFDGVIETFLAGMGINR